jgi:hypothetical protein
MPSKRDDHVVRMRGTQPVRFPAQRQLSSALEELPFRVDVKSRRDLEQAGCVDVLLDLRDVSFMDCSGPRVVVAAGEAGRRLGVIFGAGQVSRLFALTGVDHRREIADRPLLTLNSHDDPGVAA